MEARTSAPIIKLLGAGPPLKARLRAFVALFDFSGVTACFMIITLFGKGGCPRSWAGDWREGKHWSVELGVFAAVQTEESFVWCYVVPLYHERGGMAYRAL